MTPFTQVLDPLHSLAGSTALALAPAASEGWHLKGWALVLAGDADDAAKPSTFGQHHALTPEYAAPEQLGGEGASVSVDVYALGVMLYELMAGALPYAIDRHDVSAAAAIVRTVLANQPVLLFDEPNSGLDIVSSRRLVELIRGLCRTMGKPALVTVHHFEELLPLADRVLVIDPRTGDLTEVPADSAAVMKLWRRM